MFSQTQSLLRNTEKDIKNCCKKVSGLTISRKVNIANNMYAWTHRTDTPTTWGGTYESLLILKLTKDLEMENSINEQSLQNTIRGGIEWLKSQQRDNEGWGTREYRKSQIESTAWGIITLASLDEYGDAIQKSSNWLLSIQNQDGSWGTVPHDIGRIYSTSVVLRSLCYAGFTKHYPRIAKGLDWLKSIQNDDGGWGFIQNSKSNVACTSHVFITFTDLDSNKKLFPSIVNYIQTKYRPNQEDWGNIVESREIEDKELTTVHISTAWAVQALIRAYAILPHLVSLLNLEKAIHKIMREQHTDGSWRLPSNEEEVLQYINYNYALALFSYLSILRKLENIEHPLQTSQVAISRLKTRLRRATWLNGILLVMIFLMIILLYLQPTQLNLLRQWGEYLLSLLNTNQLFYTIVGGIAVWVGRKAYDYYKSNFLEN